MWPGGDAFVWFSVANLKLALSHAPEVLRCKAMLVIVGCCLFAWVSDIYRPGQLFGSANIIRLCPGWGAVRRFDSDGNEDLRLAFRSMELGGAAGARESAAKGVPPQADGWRRDGEQGLWRARPFTVKARGVFCKVRRHGER